MNPAFDFILNSDPKELILNSLILNNLIDLFLKNS